MESVALPQWDRSPCRLRAEPDSGGETAFTNRCGQHSVLLSTLLCSCLTFFWQPRSPWLAFCRMKHVIHLTAESVLTSALPINWKVRLLVCCFSRQRVVQPRAGQAGRRPLQLCQGARGVQTQARRRPSVLRHQAQLQGTPQELHTQPRTRPVRRFPSDGAENLTKRAAEACPYTLWFTSHQGRRCAPGFGWHGTRLCNSVSGKL